MKYDALKHYGIKFGRLILNLIGELSGETVQRYIQLSKLNYKLLEMADNKNY